MNPTNDPNPEVHPARVLDEVVHQRTRLGILTVLAETGRADFPYLKRVLGLTDGNLGRHIEVLAEHELVSVTKGYEGKRPRTWIEITALGSGALNAQVTAMRQIVDRVDNSQQPDSHDRSSSTPPTNPTSQRRRRVAPDRP